MEFQVVVIQAGVSGEKDNPGSATYESVGDGSVINAIRVA
jgi:hypothetical protein